MRAPVFASILMLTLLANSGCALGLMKAHDDYKRQCRQNPECAKKLAEMEQQPAALPAALMEKGE